MAVQLFCVGLLALSCSKRSLCLTGICKIPFFSPFFGNYFSFSPLPPPCAHSMLSSTAGSQYFCKDGNCSEFEAGIEAKWPQQCFLERRNERGFCRDDIKVVYCGVFILDLPYLNCSECSIIHGWGLGLRWFSCCWNLLEQSTAQPTLLLGLLLCIWNQCLWNIPPIKGFCCLHLGHSIY